MKVDVERSKYGTITIVFNNSIWTLSLNEAKEMQMKLKKALK